MDNNLFNKKISELLEQNEDMLPSFANKEIVWKNIEYKLQKSRRIKLFYYTAISAAACVILTVSFPFLFHLERINKNEARTDSPQVEIKEFISKIDENEQLIVKEDSDSIGCKKRKVEKPVSKKPVVVETTKEEEAIFADALISVIEEELSTVQENIEGRTLQPDELSTTIPKNEIRVRVSLAPGKQKNEKKQKIKFKLNNSKLNHYESNTNYVAGTVVPFTFFRSTEHIYSE